MEIVRALALADTWTQDPFDLITHITRPMVPPGSTYLSSHTLLERKKGTEIIPAAFTDHHAVVLRLRINDNDVRSEPNRWKMNPLLMLNKNITHKISVQLAIWQNYKRFYPDNNVVGTIC